MSSLPRLLVLALVLLPLPLWTQRPAHAQGPGQDRDPQAQAQPASRYRISLLTVSPGDEFEERLGHSALAVEDLKTGKEVAYNFGTFGATDNLVFKFLHKKLQFWVSAMNPGEVAVRYAGREIRVQELALSESQAGRLATMLEQRVRPEDRNFDYDLYTANCVTPIRDVLDVAMDGALRRHTNVPANETYRQVIMHGLRTMPLLGAFSALAYGTYTDEERSRWELLFMPDRLHDALAEMQSSAAAGGPLVRGEKSWRGEGFTALSTLPDPRLGAAALGILILAGLLCLLSPQRRQTGRALLGASGIALALIYGGLGAALYYLGYSAHESVHHNANRYLFNPLDLTLVPLLLLLTLGRLRPTRVRVLLLLLGGTTALALSHLFVGHGLGLCRQQHSGVLEWAMLGRMLLWGCVGALLWSQRKHPRQPRSA